MPLTIANLCPGRPEELPDGNPLGPVARRCSCGLPWDPSRGPHTTTGLVLPAEVVERLMARVVLAIFEAHLVELEQLTDTDDNGREYEVEIDLAARRHLVIRRRT